MASKGFMRLSPREKFDRLFELLVGIHPDETQKNGEGWLFIPPDSGFGDLPKDLRGRLDDLSNHQWKNHMVDNNYAGWWIKRPE